MVMSSSDGLGVELVRNNQFIYHIIHTVFTHLPRGLREIRRANLKER